MDTALHCVIRADAGPLIGGGHILRCLSIALELHSRGWVVTLVTVPEADEAMGELIPNWVNKVFLKTEKASDPDAMCSAVPSGCRLVIVDHYALDKSYERSLRGWAEKIVVVDDLANRPHDCDFLIDHTYGRKAEDYKNWVPPGCTILCGSDYTLLRSEFARRRLAGIRSADDGFPPRRALVFMGLGDSDCLSVRALQAFVESKLELQIRVLLGAQSPAVVPAMDLAERYPNIEVLTNAPDMAAHLEWADFAIGTAGTSAWERCCLAVPTIALTITDHAHDNQRIVAEALKKHGGALELGEGINISVSDLSAVLREFVSNQEQFRNLSVSAAKLCDGLGASRVAMHLDPYRCHDGDALTLRRFTEADASLLFSWQSTPSVRQYFRNPEPPSPSQHAEWVKRRLDLISGVTEIIMKDGEPAGHVCLDSLEEPDTFEVSILVAPEFQGKGVGSGALRLLRRLIPYGRLRADVDPKNLPSLRAFSRAGYDDHDGWLVSVETAELNSKCYIVATIKPWNIELYQQRHGDLPGQWHLISSAKELTEEKIKSLKPRYIFFPHWSRLVPESILELAECVCFHMTDLPFGRGGSPLQNLIVRGIKNTKLTAFRMEAGLDTGPIYMKRPLSLEGSAEQIFRRAAALNWDMIEEMVRTEPQSVAQEGEPVVFTRRKPEQSLLPKVGSVEGMFDHIRMLDATSYPKAFLEHGEWRLEFVDANQDDDGVSAKVRIFKKGDE